MSCDKCTCLRYVVSSISLDRPLLTDWYPHTQGDVGVRLHRPSASCERILQIDIHLAGHSHRTMTQFHLHIHHYGTVQVWSRLMVGTNNGLWEIA